MTWEHALLKAVSGSGLDNEALMIKRIREFKIILRQLELRHPDSTSLQNDLTLGMMFSAYVSGVVDGQNEMRGIFSRAKQASQIIKESNGSS